MWNSKGRSGYGDQTILGDYDDWDGLSLNGRQVKNELTNETRNLSGADYWQARKSIKPEEITPKVWVNGKPNIKAFADTEQPKKTKKSIPIAHQITPQSRTLDKLDTQELALHNTYKNDEVSLEEYEELLYALDQKRERAFKSLCKALGRDTTSNSDYPVGQGGYDDKTLNTYNKALTKGGFKRNVCGVEGVNTNSFADDVKILLTGSVIGLIILLTLINI